MFVTVELLSAYKKLLTYSVPASYTESLIGAVVQVPLGTRVEFGLVVDQTLQLPPGTTFTVKPIIGVAPIPSDTHYRPFVEQLARYYQIEPTFFMRRMRTCLHHAVPKEENNDIVSDEGTNESSAATLTMLTDEQSSVVQSVQQDLNQQKYVPTVLAGVTGSGKTEVYKRLILESLLLGKSVIFLLPEVTLAHRFERIFSHQLPRWAPVCGFHSKITVVQRQQLWNRLLRSEPVVIIGVHLPILLPIANLGLIIVDEEHEAGYQEKQHPRVHTVEAALMRAKHYSVPIVLGSATPSISSLYNVQKRGWRFFQLKKRFGGIFPEIKVVNLLQNKKRKNFWISAELEAAIADRMSRKEQTIIFLNRRGMSFCLQCSACGFMYRCSQCSVSLTVHANNRLICHYCGYTKEVPLRCDGCGAADAFVSKGIGTQKMVQMLQVLFPQARIARADQDVTRRKKEWQKTLAQIDNGQIDVIVGTQSIAKGFHFPRVSLVGIIWADANIHFPHFAATEQVLQQLIQVAGRAGRSGLASTVIVQAMIDHHIFAHLNEQNYVTFYEGEIQNREMAGYPPCTRFVEIELRHYQENVVERDAQAVACALFAAKQKINDTISVLGPAQPIVNKIKGIHLRKVYIKGERFDDIIHLFQSIQRTDYASHIFFTPNPMQ